MGAKTKLRKQKWKCESGNFPLSHVHIFHFQLNLTQLSLSHFQPDQVQGSRQQVKAKAEAGELEWYHDGDDCEDDDDGGDDSLH